MGANDGVNELAVGLKLKLFALGFNAGVGAFRGGGCGEFCACCGCESRSSHESAITRLSCTNAEVVCRYHVVIN